MGNCYKLNLLETKCNKHEKWVKHKLCQQSCWDVMNITYDGKPCCDVPTSEPVTEAPTQASPSCTICDDEPTKKMNKKGQSCTDININNKCNKNASWITKGYCQLSCYNQGLGYEGDVCCLSDSTSSPTKAPASQPPSLPACTICDDNPTKKMNNKGQSCTDYININKKCNKSASWITEGYCQLSCYNQGL